MNEEKKLLHQPKENTNKMLIGVSDITAERIKTLSTERHLTYAALISLAIELFENMAEDVSITIK